MAEFLQGSKSVELWSIVLTHIAVDKKCANSEINYGEKLDATRLASDARPNAPCRPSSLIGIVSCIVRELITGIVQAGGCAKQT